MYFTWNDNDKAKASGLNRVAAGYLKINEDIMRAKSFNTYRNITEPNTSVRDAYSRDDYNYFRPNEANPTKNKEIIAKCIDAYNRFPIVRNVIDLMGDFAIKGISVVHTNPKLQDFGQKWFAKVNGPQVSERIANILLKAGNVVVKRGTAKLPTVTYNTLKNKKAVGADYKLKNIEFPEDEIPISYTTLNPATIDVIGGELAPFLGHQAFRFAVSVPSNFANNFGLSKKEVDNIIAQLPQDIREALVGKNKGKAILLDKNKTIALYYKKDDWEVWAKPIIYPLLDDLSMYDKLRMADRAALDGAISHVRLWRLGDIKERIFPSPEVINKLATILNNNVGGGCMDLVWGPELDFKETTTEVYKFLGMEKYVPHLEAIYQGLGVPPSMTGSSGASGGFTNNVVSLNVLIERLEYIRKVITAFWEQEFAILQYVFGFKKPFSLSFESPKLTDETATNKLLVDLVDRNIVSEEFILKKFGAIPEMEKVRVNREQKEREDGERAPKTGQFNLLTKNQDEQTKTATAPKEKKKKAKKSKDGRPLGSPDINPRKPKNVTPRTSVGFVDVNLWALDALEKITNITQSVYLKSRKKANLRQLTASEFENYERFKFSLLCSLKPMSNVTEDIVKDIIKNEIGLPEFVDKLYKTTVGQYVEKHGEQPSIERLRQIQASIVALYKNEEIENGED